MVTLTYDSHHLPEPPHLDHSHVKRFLNQARHELGMQPRYFCAGEYGKKGRPHYHILLFGYEPEDLVEYVLADRQRVKMSEQVTSWWKHPNTGLPRGMATVDPLTFASAGYVAGYVAKKIHAEMDTSRHVAVTDGVTNQNGQTRVRFVDEAPEYRQMSRRPGIAREWIENPAHLFEIYPADLVRVGEYKFKPPAYYDQVLKRVDERLHREVLQARLEGEAEYAKKWTSERQDAAYSLFLEDPKAGRSPQRVD
jgi:hypothetical protein